MRGRGCGCHTDLDELLSDEIMGPVMESAGIDADGLRTILVEVARRLEDGGEGND